MEYEAPLNPYEGMSASTIARKMKELSDRMEKYETVKKQLQKEYDAIRKTWLPQAMEDEGLTNMNIDGVGRVSLRSDIYVSIPAAARDTAYDWLRGTGHGGIIKQTVHAGTLRSTVKEMLRKGEVLPDHEVLKVTPFDIAVLTKQKES
ncbi:MAG: hypothetical protein Q9M13_10160 [Mariprofundales bacterium]|nr:hypothetical protein [Mariprofundales bacterium]